MQARESKPVTDSQNNGSTGSNPSTDSQKREQAASSRGEKQHTEARKQDSVSGGQGQPSDRQKTGSVSGDRDNSGGQRRQETDEAPKPVTNANAESQGNSGGQAQDSSSKSRISGGSQNRSSPAPQQTQGSDGQARTSNSGSGSSGRAESDNRTSSRSNEGQAAWGNSTASGSSESSGFSPSRAGDSGSKSQPASGAPTQTRAETGQSNSGRTQQKTGMAEAAGNSGKQDQSENTKRESTTEDEGKDRPETASTGGAPKQDTSFGASTSVLDFFRRNANAGNSQVSQTPVTSARDPKPAKTEQAATSANASKTDDKAAKGLVVPRAQAVDMPFRDKGTFRPREVIASNLGPGGLEKVRAAGFGVPSTLAGMFGFTSIQRLAVPAGMSEAEAYKILREKLPTSQFGPNHIYRITPQGEEKSKTLDVAAAAQGSTAAQCPGDKCFGPSLIGWKAENRTCARKVRIGIIDTSYDLSHVAFAGRRFSSGNFLGEGVTSPHDWHGTAVLSLLAGDARGGTPGLVPDAEFYLASAFKTDSEGNASADTLGVLNALSWLEALDVKIVNMSFSGPRDDLIGKAIGVMSAKGVIFVAAAGNRGPDAPPSYPAAYPDVIAVTAVGRAMQGYRNANRGDYVDAAAPGIEVWTALPNGKAGFRTGTSFAAPFFTGVLAAQSALHSGRQTKMQILSTLKFQDLGQPGRDPVYGEGLVKAPERCLSAPEIARRPENGTPKMGIGAGLSRPQRPVPSTAPQAAFGPASQ
jgi:hypothetical protein